MFHANFSLKRLLAASTRLDGYARLRREQLDVHGLSDSLCGQPGGRQRFAQIEIT